jgi:hypothetical protein
MTFGWLVAVSHLIDLVGAAGHNIDKVPASVRETHPRWHFDTPRG